MDTTTPARRDASTRLLPAWMRDLPGRLRDRWNDATCRHHWDHEPADDIVDAWAPVRRHPDKWHVGDRPGAIPVGGVWRCCHCGEDRAHPPRTRRRHTAQHLAPATQPAQ